MKARALTFPEIGQISATRFVLGAGIGILVSGKFNKDERKGAGLALLAVGILTSIPIGLAILAKRPVSERAREEPAAFAA
jgi:hypothetical protein